MYGGYSPFGGGNLFSQPAMGFNRQPSYGGGGYSPFYQQPQGFGGGGYNPSYNPFLQQQPSFGAPPGTQSAPQWGLPQHGGLNSFSGSGGSGGLNSNQGAPASGPGGGPGLTAGGLRGGATGGAPAPSVGGGLQSGPGLQPNNGAGLQPNIGYQPTGIQPNGGMNINPTALGGLLEGWSASPTNLFGHRGHSASSGGQMGSIMPNFFGGPLGGRFQPAYSPFGLNPFAQQVNSWGMLNHNPYTGRFNELAGMIGNTGLSQSQWNNPYAPGLQHYSQNFNPRLNPFGPLRRGAMANAFRDGMNADNNAETRYNQALTQSEIDERHAQGDPLTGVANGEGGPTLYVDGRAITQEEIDNGYRPPPPDAPPRPDGLPEGSMYIDGQWITPEMIDNGWEPEGGW